MLLCFYTVPLSLAGLNACGRLFEPISAGQIFGETFFDLDPCNTLKSHKTAKALAIMHLTEHRYPDTATCANSEKSEGAGAPVLELTDSMILAGAEIIHALARDVQDSWLSAEEVAEKVFEAIIEASCSTPITSPQRALPSRLQRLSFPAESVRC